jgi:ferredoxin
MTKLALSSLLLLALGSAGVGAFAVGGNVRQSRGWTAAGGVMTTHYMVAKTLLEVELEKPLGIILEEVQEGTANGVKVEELSDAGSAYASEYKDQLVGLKVATVMGQDVASLTFDDVMDTLINAPSPLKIAFELPEEEEEVAPPQFEVGQTVTITVLQEGVETVGIEAKVGDNLRQTLLDNKVELYRGMKKKFGNCGGGGQCLFCAVAFEESEGWEARSDYEEQKIGKFPKARLACINNIQGPATIRVQ